MRRTLILSVLFVLCAFAVELGREPFRPQFHFSPRKNWTNDPCGLVYFKGLYHLFFQHNPEGDQWGHMSWGHAVSSDLVHWQERPVAIPENGKVMIFTGSSVADLRNTSGLCAGGSGCIVSIYTGHTGKTDSAPGLQNQNLAASNDGQSWKNYSGNPVLDLHKADFRDPKVIWHEPSHQWIMTVVLPDEKKASFYGSPDLKAWKHLSDFGPEGSTGGVWECPDLYELPVDGNAKNTRWVLKIGLNPGHLFGGSGEQYFVGRFDGVRFQNDNAASQTLWLDYGRDCYCALTWNGAPRQQPPTMIGWMNNWQYAGAVPTSPWRGQMTLPRQLALKTTPAGIRLFQQPVAALDGLHGSHARWSGQDVAKLNQQIAAKYPSVRTADIRAEVDLGSAKQAGWRIRKGSGEEAVVGYDVVKQEFFVDRTHAGNTAFSERFPSRTAAPVKLRDGRLRFRVVLDLSSIEVFVQDGEVALTNLIFPSPSASGLELFSDGAVKQASAELYEMKSAW